MRGTHQSIVVVAISHTKFAAVQASKSLHIPLPLDHFFFCFFAPDAAGAILTDLLGVCGG